MRRTRLAGMSLLAAGALTLAGCSSDSDASDTNSNSTQQGDTTSATQQQSKFSFGDTWTVGDYEFTPTIHDNSEDGQDYIDIVWHVTNNSDDPIEADSLFAELYGDGSELDYMAYDSLSEPDIMPGDDGKWVEPYEQPDDGTKLQLQAEVTSAESGTVYFTGTYPDDEEK